MYIIGVEDPTFFRIGTCGGVGHLGGTVVVTDEAVDGRLLPVHENVGFKSDFKEFNFLFNMFVFEKRHLAC